MLVCHPNRHTCTRTFKFYVHWKFVVFLICCICKNCFLHVDCQGNCSDRRCWRWVWGKLYEFSFIDCVTKMSFKQIFGHHTCTSKSTFFLTSCRIFDSLTVYYAYNCKNYNFLDCDWFKKLLHVFSTYSLAKLLSDSLLSDSSISQSHSKL